MSRSGKPVQMWPYGVLAGMVFLMMGCASSGPASLPADPAVSSARPPEPEKVPVMTLAADDPGLIRLAASLAGKDVIAFAPEHPGGPGDGELKAALAEALLERQGLAVIVFDAGCEPVSMLEDFIAGRTQARPASDIISSAGLPAHSGTPALASLMMRLRGWNAVYPEKPVRLAGHLCDQQDAAQGPALFWDQPGLPAGMGQDSPQARPETMGRRALIDQAWPEQGAVGNALDAAGAYWSASLERAEGQILFMHATAPAWPAG